jgi:hypothetical protein
MLRNVGVPYGSRTRVAAVKEKRRIVIQRNLAAWIALYRTLRTHGNSYWTPWTRVIVAVMEPLQVDDDGQGSHISTSRAGMGNLGRMTSRTESLPIFAGEQESFNYLGVLYSHQSVVTRLGKIVQLRQPKVITSVVSVWSIVRISP